MKKIQVLIACTLLSVSGFTFASSSSLPITNKSNCPIIVQWAVSSASSTKSFTPSIAPGTTYSLSYTGTLSTCNVYFLKAGATVAAGVQPSTSQMADIANNVPAGFQPTNSALASLAGIFAYGDINTTGGVLTVGGSLSRAVGFVYGTLLDPATNPESATFQQKVLMETFKTDGSMGIAAF